MNTNACLLGVEGKYSWFQRSELKSQLAADYNNVSWYKEADTIIMITF